jgi:hypothetical protein
MIAPALKCAGGCLKVRSRFAANIVTAVISIKAEKGRSGHSEGR